MLLDAREDKAFGGFFAMDGSPLLLSYYRLRAMLYV